MTAAAPEVTAKSPFLWILLPWIAGILLFFSTSLASGWVLSFLLVGLALLAVAFQFRNRAPAFALCFIPAVILLSGAGIQLRQVPPPDPAWEFLPAREFTAVIELEDTYRTHGQGRIAGIGRIVHTEAIMADLVNQRLSLSASWSGNDALTPGRGAIMEIRGVIHPVRPDTDQSFHRYLLARQVHFILRRGVATAVVKPEPAWRRVLERGNHFMVHTLGRGFSDNDPRAGLYRAMLLGDRQALSDDQLRQFRQTGTMHLFAISGLHIGIIAGVLFLLLNLTRIDPGKAALIGLAILFFYVAVTGLKPSAVRAFTMITFLWGGRFLWRPYTPFASVAASATLILILFPKQLFDLGFQLSYGVVTAILLLGLPLASGAYQRYETLHRLPEIPDGADGDLRPPPRFRLVRLFLYSFSISLVSFLASLPITAFVFGVVPLSGILLNVALVPLAAVVLSIGVGSLLIGTLPLLGWAVPILNQGAGVVLSLMSLLVEGLVRLPLHTLFYPDKPAPLGSSLAGVVVLTLILLRNARLQPSTSLLALLLLNAALLAGLYPFLS